MPVYYISKFNVRHHLKMIYTQILILAQQIVTIYMIIGFYINVNHNIHRLIS